MTHAPTAGLRVPTLSESVRRRLPGPTSVDHPIDLGGGATPGELRRSVTVLADNGSRPGRAARWCGAGTHVWSRPGAGDGRGVVRAPGRSHRILPVTGADAAAMVGDLRCAPLLHRYRGAQPCDVAAVEELLVRVGRLVEDVPEIAELDLNPVRVSEDGAVAVDVKVRVEQTTSRHSPLLRVL